MLSKGVAKYFQPAVEVEAYHWTGYNPEEVLRWLNGVFFVKEGANSELRTTSELDARGQAKSDAPSFIIIKTRTGDDRVNTGDWIVRFSEERISVYDPLTFAYTFEEGEPHEQPC